MKEKTICPGYEDSVEDADYDAITATVDEHNNTAEPGEHYWAIGLSGNKYIVFEYGNVPEPPSEEELQAQLEEYKTSKINETKESLSTYLSCHPLLWSDGKYYSVTSEKQALLTSNLALYQISAAAGIPFKLTWNSTGDECVEWTYENLAALALGIGTYVKPFVSHQQELELAIKACTTMEEVDAIAITYEIPEEPTDTTEPTEETTEGDAA